MPNAGAMQMSGITGTDIQTERKGNITVVAFTHEVKADLDPVTRRPNNKRTHLPLVVSKNIDFATPALHQAHQAGTELSLTLKLYHMPRDGNEFHYFTIHVGQAKIVGINTVMPDINASEMMHEYEEVSFAYKSIGYEILPPPTEDPGRRHVVGVPGQRSRRHVLPDPQVRSGVDRGEGEGRPQEDLRPGAGAGQERVRRRTEGASGPE